MKHACVAAIFVVATGPQSALPASLALPPVGSGVSVDGLSSPAGAFDALEIEILLEPRSLKLRGSLTSVDAKASTIALVGRTLYVDDETEFVGLDSLADVTVDAPFPWEVKAAWRRRGLYAKRIESAPGKTGETIKGTVRAWSADGAAPDSVDVDGVWVAVSAATRLTREQDFVDEVVFQNLRQEDEPGEESPYRLSLGSRLFASGSVRQNYDGTRGYSLRPEHLDTRDAMEPSLRLEGLAVLHRKWRAFAQAQVSDEVVLDETLPPGVAPPDDEKLSVQMRQIYVIGRDVAGPLGFSAGKQRLRDAREFLFDEYLDALRVVAYPWAPWTFEATLIHPVVPLGEKFETWTDVFAQVRRHQDDDASIGAYILRRSDTGSRRREPIYAGLSAHGEVGRSLRYHALGVLIRGRDKGRDLSGHAFDLGIAYRVRGGPGRPWVRLELARGSGDDPATATHEGFRQTGYEDNTSRLWGVSSTKQYGEALDPELANLEVLSAGVGLRPWSRASIEFVAHRYRQLQAHEDLDGTDLYVEAELLDGVRTPLGWGGEIVAGVRGIHGWLDVTSKLGWFTPGDAFVRELPSAWTQAVQVRANF